MKMRKRYLSLILCLVLFASLLPTAFATGPVVKVNGVDLSAGTVTGVTFADNKLTISAYTVTDKAEGVTSLIEVTGGDIEIDLKQNLDITGKTYDGVISSEGKVTFVNSTSQTLTSDAKGIVAGTVELKAAKLSVNSTDAAAIEADTVTVDATSELTAKAVGDKAEASVDISAVTAGAVTSAGKLKAEGRDYGITLKVVTGVDKQCAINDGSFEGTGAKGAFKEADGITIDSTKLAVKAGDNKTDAELMKADDASKFSSQKYVETVTYVPVENVTMKSSTTIAKGGNEPLTATITPENATFQEVEWSSNAPTVATVDSSTGEVTGVATGTASITAQSKDNPGKFATCTVTVVPAVIPVESVAITGPSTVKVGEEKNLQVTVNPSTATNKNLTYTSSDEDVLKVYADGKIKGIKAGTANVTVTSEDGSHTATREITVTEDTYITAISITGATHTLNGKGVSKVLTAVLTPTNPTNKAVNWKSSDETVCTVTQSTTNQLQATVKAVKNGECTITCASAKDASIKDTWKITVTNAEADSYKITNTSTPTWYYDNKNTNKDVTITANGPASLFNGLKIGSLTVPANTGYTLAQDTSGNTVLTVKDSWLQNNVPKTRSKLTLELSYSDGGKATGNFHVLSVSDTPFTGDSDATFAYVLLLVSGLGIVWCGLTYSRRKRTEQ